LQGLQTASSKNAELNGTIADLHYPSRNIPLEAFELGYERLDLTATWGMI
jgi:hypothetical protein